MYKLFLHSFFLVLCLSSDFIIMIQGLKMKQTKIHRFGELNKSLTLKCEVTTFLEKCGFIRPDGLQLCSKFTGEEDSWFDSWSEEKADEISIYDVIDAIEDCVDDDTMTITTNSDSCELTINTLNPDLHFGDWICEAEDLMGTAQAVITVGKLEPAKLEFEVYYGDLFLDLEEQSEISIRCNVLSNNAQADIIPGNMIFKIGNKELENDDNQLEFDDSKKVWYKMLNYKPDIYDNGEILKCVLNPKSNHETSENLNIHLYKFKVINSEDLLINHDDGKEDSEIKITFESYPSISKEEISWIISDKSDGSVIELNPGQNNENFDALDLKEGQSMQYEAYLIIKSVDYNQDFDKTIKIRANVGLETKEISIPFNVVMKEESKSTTIITSPPTQLPTKPTSTENIIVTQASENQNITEAEVKQEGASLFIIIAIIALVIILCVAFYGYRSCKSRNQPLQPVEINVEEGKALMDDKNDDKNGDKNDDKNDDKNKVEENQEQPKPSESATPAENGNLENDLKKKEQDLLVMLESPETNSDSLAEPSAPHTQNTNEKTEETNDTELPDVISQEKENAVLETENNITETENDITETEVVEENENNLSSVSESPKSNKSYAEAVKSEPESEQNITRVQNDPKTKEDHNEINEMIKSIQRTSMDIKNISNSPPPMEKEEATVEQAVPFTKYDKVSKHSKSSSSSSSSNLTSSSPSAESIEVQPKNDGTIIPNSNGPEIPWIDSPLSTPTQKRSSLGESKETTKTSPTTDSPTEPIYENSSTISEADLKRTNSINIATQTQQDENKSQEEPSLD